MSELRARTLTRPRSRDERDVADNWRLDAACRDLSADHYDPWFPTSNNKHAYDDARSVCRDCPVRQLCLKAALTEEGALSAPLRFGMRGGATPEQRAGMAGVATPKVRPSKLFTIEASKDLNAARVERRRRVAEFAKAGMTAKDIAAVYPIHEETARRDMNFLRAEGVIKPMDGRAYKPGRSCGTVRGARQHRNAREGLCVACQKAEGAS